MKFKCLLLFALFFLCAVSADAQSKLSASSRLELARNARKLSATQQQSFQAFIEITDTCDLQQLQSLGVQVQSRFGSLLTAGIPLSVLPQLQAVRSLQRIMLARPMTLCNDSARYLSRVDALHQATATTSAYTGKGVVVGVIDCGVDFNHINLCDSNGVSRVVRAYLPADSTGTAPIINGFALPGSAYETPEAITQLTTDCATLSHGSHTTGTAAGSYHGNAFYGVAPDATLVICAMPESDLTDANIANSLNYIFHYADSVGLPAVVNMSIGSHDGAHDGTSLLCQVMDSLSGPGRVCVVSAGNDGDKAIHAQSPHLTSGDIATLVLANSSHQSSVSNGFVSLWSSNDTEHAMRLALVDKTTGEVVQATPFYRYSDEMADTVYHIDLSEAFSADFGDDYVDFAFERVHKFHTALLITATHLPANVFAALQFAPDGDCELTAWGSALRFANFRPTDPLWLAGDSDMSISDLATGDSTISVGAYYSRSIAPVLSGYNPSLTTGVVLYNITGYSSYGPDANGVMRPDVVAPGTSLVSSYNRYNTSVMENLRWINSFVTIGDVRYAYGASTGTSMAAPVVTGAVALWLQARPTLTPGEVREVLRLTSNRDDFVSHGDTRRWGYGKLDAAAGLRYLLTGALRGDVNADMEVNVSDVTALINCILGITPIDTLACDVNGDTAVNVSDVTALINLILGLR